MPKILGLYMWDDDKNVRAAAKSVFTKYAPAELKERVKKNWKASYRTIDSYKFPKAIHPFLKAFESQDDFAEIALKSLIKMLSDKDTTVCQNAAQTLGIIGDKRAIKPLIKALSWVRVRESAAEALGEIGDERVVKPLIKALEGGNSNAANALGEIGDARAVEPLIKTLGKWTETRHGVNVYYAIKALVKIGDARAVEPLTKALRDGSIEVRYSAAEALGEIGDERAVEPLIEALGEGNSSAARALGKIGDERAVEPLIGALSNDNWMGRQVAAGALDKLGWVPEDDGQRAVYLIAGEDWKSLVELGEPAVEPLITALGNDYWKVCQSAAYALGEIGDERAVEPLIKALSDDDRWVVKTAKEALKKLGHEVE